MPAQGAERDVLLVDDDFEICDTLSQLLQDEGYSVATASNGLEALHYLRGATLPRLILLDLMMPVMNGWQFRHEQQRDPELASIPLVVLSADRPTQRERRAYYGGEPALPRASSYPIDPDEIDP